jgi:excisionase family DNA binding protein
MAEYLKLAEVARKLDVSEKTARRYVKSGELPSVFIGNKYRVSEDDLQEYIRGARVHPVGVRPKGPPPRSMDELLSRAGVANRTFTMSLTEIGEAFEGLSYEEAYTLAREIADARAAVKLVLSQYEGTLEEVALTVQSMEINMVANLSFQAIAERERGHAVAQGDLDRAKQIERELKEVA